MEFLRTDLETCAQARGTVVVIDVLRAFTTAAYAFGAGASEIQLVQTVEEALNVRREHPDRLLMGEVGGLPIDGFDFGNSPAEMAQQALPGISLVQRTSSGTQGMVLSRQAEHLLAASFVCAGATARRIQQLNPQTVTFVITGNRPGKPADDNIAGADEDIAGADYLEALLKGARPDPLPYLRRVRLSRNGKTFADPSLPEFPASDLDYTARLDVFEFAMQAGWEAGRLVLRKVES